jgi:hypothetical protein
LNHEGTKDTKIQDVARKNSSSCLRAFVVK